MAYLSQCQPGFSAFWRQIPLGQKRSLSPISGDAGGRPPPSDQSPSASQFRRPMAEPQPKRPKVSRDKEDYKPGNIIAIEVRNFMTFGSVIQCPGPRLNLLIGPNGSGKSSLVCAIALGLGGDPQVLGRATSVGAYVKRGEESGYIKITLRGNNDDNITIMRKIDIHNKSEWVLNGKVVPKRDVTETIQRFNIQVNNLTQFLPQDRVCEFAKLTPVQLLEETEKAVGDPQLPVLHQSLVNKSQELKTLERAVETNRVSLQQLKEQNVVLEKDVERVRQRDELLLQVESMKNKLPWLQYDIKKKEYLDAQELEKEAKGKLNEAAKVTHELKKPIETLKQEKRVLDNKCKKATEYLEGNAKKRSDIVEEDNSLAVKVQGKYNDMEELKTQEESHQQKIAQTKEKLNAAEYELHNLPPFEHPKDILDGLISQINELDKTAREIKSDKMSKEKERAYHRNNLDQCIDRLKKMENTSHKGLQALRNAGAHKIFEAYHWVQDHRQHFKKEVYGPVLLEVNVPNRVHADFLEGQVGFYMWKAFVTQDPRDRDYLYENLRSFDVPILNHVGDEGHERARFQVTDEMKELGVYSKLDEVFDAPRAVKEVLISQFGLEDSYIGTQKTDQRASDVQGLGIMSLWTPDNCYKWNRSRYSNNVSASVNSVQPARLLLCNADVREIDSLKSKITGYENTVSSLGKNIETLQSETTRLENHAATLRKEREEILYRIQNEKKKRQEKESHVRQWKLRLENLEKQEKLDDALAKLTEEVDRLKTLRFKLVSEKLKTLLNQAVIHRRDLTEKTMALIELEHKIKELEANMKHEEKLAMEASMQYEACKKKAENCRDQLSEAKRHAESIAKLTPELKKAFLELPSTIEDLEAAIHDTTSQANSLLCFNPNVLAQYESRLVKIDALAKKLEADEKDLASHLEDISSLKGRWLSTLKDLVIQINKTFSCNFQEMAVAGEVSLDERGTDFAQYGILIKVKFRQAGQLQVLSSQHQSGGERSVATILYLVSLQDLTNCPFRVVDEINQGMDPVNERKMFQQLVRAASKPNTPQCFLVTPKLLPNLEYSEAVTALTVMNGPWIEQPSKVWSCGKSWGYVTGLQRESTAENGQ